MGWLRVKSGPQLLSPSRSILTSTYTECYGSPSLPLLYLLELLLPTPAEVCVEISQSK